MKVNKGKVIFIVGSTAIGKSSLAMKLAKRLRGEIISADSMQVYKGMGIVSQAPSAKERALVKHYLVGCLAPEKEYSAAIFSKKAAAAIKSIIRRKKIPIVAGGSGLYIKALVDGLFPSPEADHAFRKRMADYAKRYGSPKLHAKLSAIDPEAALKIHHNDIRRIIRALEIYNSTGKTMTELKSGTKGLADSYDIRIFGLTAPREKIYSNIDSRVDIMFDSPLIDEIARLRRKKLSKTAAAALGIKEVDRYLAGGYGLAEAKEMLKLNTRHFAKRQIAWFKPDVRIKWFDVAKMNEKEIVSNIVSALRKGAK